MRNVLFSSIVTVMEHDCSPLVCPRVRQEGLLGHGVEEVRLYRVWA